MKRILITGANSYIGSSFENYIKMSPEQYSVDTVDMIDDKWRETSFTGYDVIFHVAGIAHIKETKKNAHLYYEINRDLSIETAKKAKAEGVKQFVFLSSMSVYDMQVGVITKETVPRPKTNYGKSKFQAEENLKKLIDKNFKIAIVRPPMVYGKGCKGNFQYLVKIVRKIPFFPYCKSQRSMIYIENLSNFIKLLIDKELSGFFFPQNSNYTQVSKMVQLIAESYGKRIHISNLAGTVVPIISLFSKAAKKAFNTLIYKDTEDFDYCYCLVSFEESVKISVT